MEVLETLVEAWEEKHIPIPPPDPVEAIRFRMEQLGLRQRDLARILGSRAHASEILNGRRSLSLSMIKAAAPGAWHSGRHPPGELKRGTLVSDALSATRCWLSSHRRRPRAPGYDLALVGQSRLVEARLSLLLTR